MTQGSNSAAAIKQITDQVIREFAPKLEAATTDEEKAEVIQARVEEAKRRIAEATK